MDKYILLDVNGSRSKKTKALIERISDVTRNENRTCPN